MVNGAGFVSSANTGYSIGRHVAYAYLPPELARPGHPLASEYFGQLAPATVAAEPLFDPADEPLFDPAGERLRA